jgi:hypothetical protein
LTQARITALILGAALLAGKWGIDQSATPLAGLFEGTWEIKSVQREGVDDPAQVGSRLIFADNTVRLESWFAAWGDEALSQTSFLGIDAEKVSHWTWVQPKGGSPTTYAIVKYEVVESQRQTERAARS